MSSPRADWQALLQSGSLSDVVLKARTDLSGKPQKEEIGRQTRLDLGRYFLRLHLSANFEGTPEANRPLYERLPYVDMPIGQRLFGAFGVLFQKHSSLVVTMAMPRKGQALAQDELGTGSLLAVVQRPHLSCNPCDHQLSSFSPTAESFGVSAQIGSGVVRGGPEVRFHDVPPGFHQGSRRVPPGFHHGSTRVPPGFHQGSTRFCEGCGVVRALKRSPRAVGDIT